MVIWQLDYDHALLRHLCSTRRIYHVLVLPVVLGLTTAFTPAIGDHHGWLVRLQSDSNILGHGGGRAKVGREGFLNGTIVIFHYDCEGFDLRH
jgi:hypothetical protein